MNRRLINKGAEPPSAARASQLLVAATLTWLSMSTASAAPVISVEPFAPQVGEPLLITVAGSWPNSCAPQLDQQQWRDGDLLLFASLPAGLCQGEPSNYAIEIDATQSLPAPVAGPLTIKFLLNEPGTDVSRLHGFRMINVAADESDVSSWQPESGLWWPEQGGQFDTSGPGVALSLEFQHQQMVTLANVYDDSGDPSWVFGSGLLDGRLVRGDLVSLFGGQALFDEYRAPETSANNGEVFIEFHTPATATAWLTAAAGPSESDGLLLQPISLVRYAFGETYQEFVRGSWIIVPEEDPSASIRLEFDGLGEQLEDWVEFPSLNADARLSCEQSERPTRRPAKRCLLVAGDREIVFDQIGLNRLRGFNSGGEAVIAVRLD